MADGLGGAGLAGSPWAVVNAAGFVRVDDAEDDPRQWRENVHGPIGARAGLCARTACGSSFSSDLVFDGEQGQPYLESDAPHRSTPTAVPSNECERRVSPSRAACAGDAHRSLLRPWDRTTSSRGRCRRCAGATLAGGARPGGLAHLRTRPGAGRLDLLICLREYSWHLVNQGEASWFQLACSALRPRSSTRPWSNQCPARCSPCAQRVRGAPLSSERGRLLPSLEAALAAYLGEVAPELLG